MEKRFDKRTGECLYYKKHESGLDIYIMPKKGYNSSYAIFGTKYGSVDSEFIVPGDSEPTKVPDGIAHYLEHKMFDLPDGSIVFDKFSKYGADANAFTSFNQTAYLFSATSNLCENLEILLDYVQTPYFTPESVQKEQGIIGQEIRMYDDNASWRLFFNFLGLLYNNNPVKIDIAGTVESIARIDSELLYKCYNTFYNLSNMTLFVIGGLDVDKTLETIEKNIKSNVPFDEEIKRIYPEEPKAVAGRYKEQVISVAAPVFMMGWKDNDVGYAGRQLFKKMIEMEILTEMIFGKGSRLYNELYNEGLINQSFSFEYSPQVNYGYTAVEGESKEPQAVYDRITQYVEGLRKTGLSRDDFDRIKKVVWGDFIRAFGDIEGYAHTFLSMSFMDIDYFDFYDVYSEIAFEDVEKRFMQQLDNECCVLSVVKPE